MKACEKHQETNNWTHINPTFKNRQSDTTFACSCTHKDLKIYRIIQTVGSDQSEPNKKNREGGGGEGWRGSYVPETAASVASHRDLMT